MCVIILKTRVIIHLGVIVIHYYSQHSQLFVANARDTTMCMADGNIKSF